MRLVKVENLTENNIIARDIFTSDYKVLLSSQTVITNEIIERLKKNNISEVYIVSDNQEEEIAILKEDVQEEIHDILQKVLEKHTYTNSGELSELVGAADQIISNILEEKDVVEKLYDIKQRSADVYEHSVNVCSTATLIALKLGIGENETHDLAVACLLHELGIRYITVKYEDCEISDMSELDAAEYKKHPIYAYSALQKESWISEEAKQIILYHHERIDGSGYPMKAMEYSQACKIIQVCDAFDEFICGIGCKKVKVHEALEYLNIYKGKKFDKQITEFLLEMVAVYPVGSYVRTNEGEIGVVLRQNKDFTDRPVIRIIKDVEGNPVKSIIIKDLMKFKTLFIEDVD